MKAKIIDWQYFGDTRLSLVRVYDNSFENEWDSRGHIYLVKIHQVGSKGVTFSHHFNYADAQGCYLGAVKHYEDLINPSFTLIAVDEARKWADAQQQRENNMSKYAYETMKSKKSADGEKEVILLRREANMPGETYLYRVVVKIPGDIITQLCTHSKKEAKTKYKAIKERFKREDLYQAEALARQKAEVASLKPTVRPYKSIEDFVKDVLAEKFESCLKDLGVLSVWDVKNEDLLSIDMDPRKLCHLPKILKCLGGDPSSIKTFIKTDSFRERLSITMQHNGNVYNTARFDSKEYYAARREEFRARREWKKEKYPVKCVTCNQEIK